MLRIGLGIAASYYALGKASEITPAAPTTTVAPTTTAAPSPTTTIPPSPPPATTTAAPPPPPPTVYSLTIYETCALNSPLTTVYSLSPSIEVGIILYSNYGLSSPYASKTFYNGNTAGSWTEYGTNGAGEINTFIIGACVIAPPPPPPPPPATTTAAPPPPPPPATTQPPPPPTTQPPPPPPPPETTPPP